MRCPYRGAVGRLPLSVQIALSSSADTLGDLARNHGHSALAQAIFDGALAIDQRKHRLEPDNTTYRRDLSISYERLADLARRASELDTARDLVGHALDIRRAIHRLEPRRVDVAVELAYTLYLSALITVPETHEDSGQAERGEVMEVLTQFEEGDLLSARGHALLSWARREDGDG